MAGKDDLDFEIFFLKDSEKGRQVPVLTVEVSESRDGS